MDVDMRHTKLSAKDAALIAGEIVKPSWASRNEGIHERISFDDTLWGFDLAGGIFYKTPLRVVSVKPGSRAEQACIKKGDKVLRINGIDTSTLTLQEAHDIILESGIHLKIAVTSPDDDEDSYYTYEDPVVDEAALAEALRKAKEEERIRRAIERANRACNLPWPWVGRKNIIYRESNCFMVPSKYENKHKDLFPDLPHIRYTDDISGIKRGTPVDWNEKPNQIGLGIPEEPKKGETVTNNEDNVSKPQENGLAAPEGHEKGKTITDNKENVSEPKENGLAVPRVNEKGGNVTDSEESVSIMDEMETNKIINEILEEGEDVTKNLPSDVDEPTHSDIEETSHNDMNGELAGPDSEEDELTQPENIDKKDVVDVDQLESIEKSETTKENHESEPQTSEDVNVNDQSSNNDSLDNVENIVNNTDNIDDYVENLSENEVELPSSDYVNDEVTKSEDDNVVDGIVGDGDIDSTNER